MADEQKAKRLEIAHVLFMDIVGYSKLLTDEQSEALQELNQIVRSTDAAREADAAGALTVLPTGDGMALVFTGSVEEPVECALEISQALRAQPSLPVRMGIHSGPIHHVKDANERENIAGVGINIAQRVMDCGDAGHILVSKRVADDLAQQRRWQPYLHELGDVEVKHGVVVSLVNLYAETIGNPTPPSRIGKLHGGVRALSKATRKGLSLFARAIFIIVGLVIALIFVLAIVSVIFAPAIMRTLDWRRSATLPQPTATAVPSLADTIKSAVAKQITDELQGELSRKKNPAVQPPPTGSAIPEKSIAVLPFVDLSQAHDQEYFCDGISEEILDALAKIKGLRVVARTSSFSFKGKNADVAEIGQKLGVTNVLEGSLRREGNRIRITAQLINARDGFHIWSDTYERELQGVFAVQDEITRSIVDALKVRLAVAPSARAPENTEAYDLYLQGLYFSNKSDEESLRKSLSFFQRALDIDPNFARAWTGIAKVWLWLADAYVRPLEAYPKAKDAASKALALDERDAEAHSYLGETKRILDYDLAGEEKELKRALEIDPNSAPAHLFMGLLKTAQGELGQGVKEIQKAERLDPLAPVISSFAVGIYLAANRIDDAIDAGKRTVQIDPNYVYVDPALANAYREKGDFQKAIELYEKGQATTHFPSVGLAITYAKMGRREDARRILEQLIEKSRKQYVAADLIATVYAALGDKDEAFRWLNRAFDEHSASMISFTSHPEFRPLRSDPRFADLLRRIGIDPAQVLRQPTQQ
jgi:TolB-like protein/Tfp pilus assembly protein PilF